MNAPSLNVISQKNLLSLMIKEKLFTKAALGRYYGISRQRVGEILKCNEVDFSKLKEIAIKEIYEKDINLEGEEWKKIIFLSTSCEYFVSNKGRVCHKIKRKIHGIEFFEKKLLSRYKYKNRHYQVTLSLLTKNKDETYSSNQYIHVLIANTFNIKKKPKGVKAVIKFKDDNIHNLNPENLYWKRFDIVK